MLRRFASVVTCLLYPPRCPLCDAFVPCRNEPCLPCDATLQRLDGDAHLELPHRIWLSRARSCFAYDGRLREALQSMKYSKRLDLVKFFGNALAGEALSIAEFDLIAAVPMSSARIRGRGYNPASLLAKKVAAMSGKKIDLGVLKRKRNVPPQVGLPRDQRIRNVTGVFEVPRPHMPSIQGAHVLIIDDVLTTGATLNDCARALTKAGADKITALTVARAL